MEKQRRISEWIEEMSESGDKRQRPMYRVVATTRDKDGTERLVNIGAAWLRVSKSGRKYLDLRLGYLKLFPVK